MFCNYLMSYICSLTVIHITTSVFIIIVTVIIVSRFLLLSVLSLSVFTFLSMIILYQPSKQDMDCLYHFCLLCREPYNHNVLWHSVYSSYYAQCIIDRFYSTAWAINKPDKCLLSGSSVAFAACSVLILILSYLFLLFFRNSSTLRNSLTANIVMLAECWI